MQQISFFQITSPFCNKVLPLRVINHAHAFQLPFSINPLQEVILCIICCIMCSEILMQNNSFLNPEPTFPLLFFTYAVCDYSLKHGTAGYNSLLQTIHH